MVRPAMGEAPRHPFQEPRIGVVDDSRDAAHAEADIGTRGDPCKACGPVRWPVRAGRGRFDPTPRSELESDERPIDVFLQATPFAARAEYVFDEFFARRARAYRICGLAETDRARESEGGPGIYYGPDAAGFLAARPGFRGIAIQQSAEVVPFFASRRPFDAARAIEEEGIPFLLASSLPPAPAPSVRVLGIDPIASAFHFLSGYQETVFLYRRFLEHAASRGAALLSPGDLSAWWRSEFRCRRVETPVPRPARVG
ncbi:MAG: hypothetical protein HY720_21150 [Planctomycetes bacterium]|nr:hypothetical protein [Planctomycetota bacterium]